jgi:hypothetical protein
MTVVQVLKSKRAAAIAVVLFVSLGVLFYWRTRRHYDFATFSSQQQFENWDLVVSPSGKQRLWSLRDAFDVLYKGRPVLLACADEVQAELSDISSHEYKPNGPLKFFSVERVDSSFLSFMQFKTLLDSSTRLPLSKAEAKTSNDRYALVAGFSVYMIRGTSAYDTCLENAIGNLRRSDFWLHKGALIGGLIVADLEVTEANTNLETSDQSKQYGISFNAKLNGATARYTQYGGGDVSVQDILAPLRGKPDPGTAASKLRHMIQHYVVIGVQPLGDSPASDAQPIQR